MVSYERYVCCNLSCLLQTYCHLSIIQKLFVSLQFFKTHGVISYGSGWKKDVVNQCLQFAYSVNMRRAEVEKEGAGGAGGGGAMANSKLFS